MATLWPFYGQMGKMAKNATTLSIYYPAWSFWAILKVCTPLKTFKYFYGILVIYGHFMAIVWPNGARWQKSVTTLSIYYPARSFWAILKVCNLLKTFKDLLWHFSHVWPPYGHFMVKWDRMAKKCYHPVYILYSPVILSHFEGLYPAKDL